jgi:uncharacterized protein (TIGR04255 family)
MTASQDESRSVTNPRPLPSFREPPVIEVVLAVSFETMQGLDNVQVGRLWEAEFRADFPKVEEQPPYFPPVERFGHRARMPAVKLEMFDAPPMPRYWFINESDTQVIQLQNNWFACNWRKRPQDPEYRRYASIREPFAEYFQRLSRFAEAETLDPIKPIQCEVTYINHIFPNEEWKSHGDLSRIVRLWRENDPSGFLPAPEQVQFLASYVLPDEPAPQGRLHVAMQPAFTVEDEQPIYVLNLTARGAPLGDNLEGILGFLDTGHEWVVRGFAAVTSDVMQRVWGRDDI